MVMKIYPAMLMAVILFASSAPAHGNGGDAIDLSLIRKVPELKQACNDASKSRWESGITSQMLQASFDYQECLIRIIQQLLNTYYPPENRDFMKRVEEIASKIRPLYWDIYCLREELCGSMYNVMSTGNQSWFIEDVLKTMMTHLELEMQ